MTALARLCSAGRDHAAVKLDAHAWRELVFVGAQPLEATATEPAEELELRTCECGSTLGRRKLADVHDNLLRDDS
jgi:hypothetical protein